MSFVVAILVVGLAYVVLKRVRVIMANQVCLTDEDLDDYLEGRFRPNSSAHKQVVAHLGVCEKCRQRLRAMEENQLLE